VKFRLPGLCQISGKDVATVTDRPEKFPIAGSFFVKRLIFAAHGGNSAKLDSTLPSRDGAEGNWYAADPNPAQSPARRWWWTNDSAGFPKDRDPAPA